MINKIDNLPASRPSAGGRRIDSGSAESRPAMPNAASARTSTTAGKSLLERATNSAKSGTDVDIARVSEIKTAIARGEFSIDPKAVARAFINMESA